jgi:hypothetical protein
MFVAEMTMTPDRMPFASARAPFESAQELLVAEWLRARGVLFARTSSKGRCRHDQPERGAPNIFVYTQPPGDPYAHGLAIKLKTPKNEITQRQEKWLADLRDQHWRTCVAFSADEAIEELVKLGYGR